MNAQNQGTLNQFLFPPNSPIAPGTLPSKQVPWEAGINQPIYQKRIVTTTVNITKALGLSNSAFAVFTVGPGSQLELTTTLSSGAPHINDPLLAMPYVSLYQQPGTVTMLGTAQIFPKTGNGIAIGAYTVQAGLDWHQFSASILNGNLAAGSAPYTVAVTNNGTVSQTIVFVSQWMYYFYNSVNL